MSDEIRHERTDPNTGFEHEDLSAKGLYAFLLSLALFGVLVYFVLLGLLHFMNKYDQSHQPPQSPLAKPETNTRSVSNADIEKFPQPRLESDERREITGFRLQEEKTLHSYGWVNANAGTMHIPIDRAMELVAQRGLPTKPQAGAVPPSPVNTARQAAEKSDTGGAPAAKPK